ncbi:sialic acid binding Ig-like lectin 15, like [Thunnus thynnus]|uniref:sialic acid binding Ig-like lectin 15, like n=1 Tax=Thunnus thynnus TaxID=8237 RepID=UPI003528C4C2
MSQFFLLIVSVIITGSLSVSWDMFVSLEVSVSRGEDAVLSCSFTHPGQQDYSGTITVKWLARESDSQPFFQCSVKNNSMEGLGNCSGSGLRFHLDGDPRQGALSLLIRTVQLTDNGAYYCRVELDQRAEAFQKPTHLNVTAKPQILSLSVMEDGATRRLQCEVEGHPTPSITWLSASTPLPADQVQTSESGQYRRMSSVPYPEEDQRVITCRAESALGAAERRFPHSNTLLISLTVCSLVVLLLLLLTGFIIYRLKHRGGNLLKEETCAGASDVSPVYENIEVVVPEVENHRPADGDVESQPVYCDVTLHCSTSSQHASFKSSTQSHEDKDVIYSPVNVQQ